MPFTIDPGAIIVGAGNPYYRAVGVLTPWSGLGATLDDSAIRIRQSFFTPDLNGMLGAVQGLDYKSEEMAEMEFTLAEVAGSKLALPIAGATSTAQTGAATGSGVTTDLDGALAAGVTTITVTDATGLAVGDVVKVGTGGTAEFVTITAISSNDLSFRDALRYAHADAEAVVESDDDAKTLVTGSTTRRMADSVYNEWAFVAEAPDGYYEMVFDSGISTTDTAEMSFGDETTGAIRTTIQSRYAGATPTTAPWTLRVPA